MGSRASRGKILKIIKRKVPQEPREERSSRSSRVNILKRAVSQEPQEDRSSRSLRSAKGKILKRIHSRIFVALLYAGMLYL
jgi:hypothetical protein